MLNNYSAPDRNQTLFPMQTSPRISSPFCALVRHFGPGALFRFLRLLLAALCCSVAAAETPAQSVIAGRVFNAATKEYVRNAKNVVASDNYGDLTMGDVGEFMKSMPGLSLDYVEVDTSAVRIGGLDPKYSLFTTDGARMPTGTSNNNTGRQNSFEQMSITGIESIEFNNTLTASMDADSPGGS